MSDPALQGPEGVVARQKLLDNGYTAQEVDQWQASKTQEMFDKGWQPKDIDAFWGKGDKDMSSAQNVVQQTFNNMSDADKQRVAQTPWDMFRAGLQTSDVEVPFGKPTVLPPQHAGMAQDILYRFGQAVGDIPFTVAGWMGGAAVGGTAGTAAAGPAGGVIAGTIGAGAGSAALPEAWRRVWMEHNENPNGYKTWGEFWSHTSDIIRDVGQQAIIGGVAGPAGAGAGRLAAPLGGFTERAANTVAMAGAATATGAALDGHIPTTQDVVSASVLALGMHGAGEFVGATQRFVPSDRAQVVASNLRDTYVETGRNPMTIAQRAANDLVVQGEVLGPTAADGTRITPELDRLKLPEPTPYAKPAEAAEGEEPPKPVEAPRPEPDDSRALAIQGDRNWAPEPGPALPALTEGGGQPPAEPPAGEPGHPRPEEPMTPAQARETILSTIAPQAREGVWPDWANPRKWLSDFQGQLTPARNVDMMIGADEKALGAEDYARQTYASSGRLNEFFRLGSLRITDPEKWTLARVNDSSLAKAYQAVKEDGGNVMDFTATRMALRSLEKAQQGIEIHPAITPEVATAFLKEPGLMEKYGRGLEIMKEHKDGLIDYGHDAHLFSPAMAAAMKSLNKVHIFLRRVQDPNYTPGGPNGKVYQPIRKMEGGEGRFGDVVTGDFENANAIVSMADRNLARLNIIDHVVGRVDPEMKRLGYDFSRVEAKDLDRDQLLQGQILDAEGAPLSEPEKEGLLPFLASRRFDERANAARGNFLIFRNGEPEVWHTDNEDLRAVLGMEAHGIPAPVFQFAIKLAGLERTGIIGSGSFLARSLLHQQTASMVTGRGAGIPFWNLIKGLPEILGHTEAFREAEAYGVGGQGAMSILDRDPMLREITSTFDKAGTWSSIMNTARHPYDAWLGLIHRLHQASAVGGFMRLKQQGYDPAKAAMVMRTDYLDHAEPLAASWANTFARMVPFMTTGLKDIEQVGRALQDRPLSTILNGLVKLTLPTIALSYVNAQVDKTLPPGSRYQDLPEWRKLLFWNVPVAGVHIAIPKPYAVGYLFAGLPGLVMDNMIEKRPTDAAQIGKALVEQMLPPAIPTVVSPIMDQVTNTHFSSGTPLVPSSLADVTNWMQYKPDTTLMARKLTQVLGPAGMGGPNISPIVLDNYIQSWAGTLPMTVMRALDSPWRDPGPPRQWSDNPLFGSFIARNPGTSSQVVEDLFDKMHEFEVAHNSFKLAEKRMDPEELQYNRTAMAFEKIGVIRNSLRRQMAAINAINASKTLTPEEKTKRGDQLTKWLVLGAERSLDYLNRIEK